MKTIALLAGLLVSSVSSAALAYRPVQTADIPELVRTLEREPLAPGARKLRQDLLAWATQTRDVTVTVCDVLGPVPGSTVPYGPELLLQAMLGNAAFQLENPASKDDEEMAQMAGITSLLRAYQATLAADPNARIPQYDTWLVELEAGRLARDRALVIKEKCSGGPAMA
ncbi:hypothetical protein [Luteimonas deserti]|uniref:Uncharacterized protein n=1 Tax=Luteimonas deserti TaxID=2752306 RepID=A0A7Z0U0P9_9GAMM|nr:hypothetical protein [Luteimonas deserti]NYZ63488.1 hypothetical protein [Luteimonas deserti]